MSDHPVRLERWRVPPSDHAPSRLRGNTGERTLVVAPAGFGKRAFMCEWAERLRGQGWSIHWLGLDAPEPPASSPRRAACFIEATGAAPLETLLTRWSLPQRPPRRVFVSATHYPADLARFSAWRIVDAQRLALSARDLDAAAADIGPPLARQLVHYTAGWPAAIALFLEQWRGAAETPADFTAALAALACRLKDFIEQRLLGACAAPSRRFLADLALFQPLGIETAVAICELDDFDAVWRDLRSLAPLVAIDADARIVLSPLLRDYANRFGARTAARSQRLLDRAAGCVALDLQRTVHDLALCGNVRLAAGLIEKAGGLLLLVDQGVNSCGDLLRTLAPGFRPLEPAWLDHVRSGCDVLCSNRVDAAHDCAAAQDPSQRALLRALLLINRAELQTCFDAPQEIAALAAADVAAHDPRQRAYVLAIRIFFAQRHGPLSLAQHWVERIGPLYRRHGFGGSADWLTVYAARNAFAAGDLSTAQQLATRLLDGASEAVDPLLQAFARYLVAACACERADFARMTRAAEATDDGVAGVAVLEGDVARCVLPEIARAWRGQVLDALERLGQVAQHAERLGRQPLWAVASAARLELLALHLSSDGALRARLYHALESVWRDCARAAAVPWLVVEAVGRARFLDECTTPARAAAAAETAARMFELALQSGYPLALAAARVMQARVMLQTRRHPAAKRLLTQALETAAARDAWRLFLPLGRENLRPLRQFASGKDPRFSVCHERIARLFAQGDSAGPRLTPRELAIVSEVMAGKSSKLIARALCISPETVKSHLKAIFAKCGATSRAQLRAALFVSGASQLQVVPGKALMYPSQDAGTSAP